MYNRRVKLLVIPYSDVLNNLNMVFDGQVVITKKHLPIECEVLSVHNDQQTHAFIFEIYNKEFDVVKPGQEAPIMNGKLVMQAFKLSRIEK